MTARVAFKKRKVVHERVVWIVSVFDTPNDIKRFDIKTMWRLGLELYGKNAKAEKQIIIREILDKKFISHSTLTIDEHKESITLQVTPTSSKILLKQAITFKIISSGLLAQVSGKELKTIFTSG